MDAYDLSAAHSTKARRLERAIQHVTDLWLPVQAPLLERIRRGFQDGTYELDIDFLIDDLRNDLALLCYCVRELAYEDFAEKARSPIDLLRKAGVARLKVILAVEPGAISRHVLDLATAEQISRLHEVLTSATVAESIAELKGKEGEDGFSTALLRQLGLMLIAWNYPSMYRRACERAARGTPIEDSLDETLGFSPSLLAAALMQGWSALRPELRYAVGGRAALADDEIPELPKIESGASEIAKICEIGEALVRASNPEHYPTARSDWNESRKEVARLLGPDALSLLQQRLQKNTKSYAELFPAEFSGRPLVEIECRIEAFQKLKFSKANPYLDQCRSVLKKTLVELYEHASDRGQVRRAVEVLVRDVIPAAGFCGGAIYTHDPTSARLVPRLRIGKVELRVLNTLGLHERSATNPIAAAFECATPLLVEERSPSGDPLSCIAGAVGGARPIGVLYLEFSPIKVEGEEQINYLVHFKAIVQAFNDCIGRS